MLHLSNFSGCIIHPGSLYNGRLNTYITWEASKYVIVYFPKEGHPQPKTSQVQRKYAKTILKKLCLLCLPVSSSCWNHNPFIPKHYAVKIKPERDPGPQTMYLDVFSSRQQIIDNITKGLLHATPCGEHVTCISPSNHPNNSVTGTQLGSDRRPTKDPQETHRRPSSCVQLLHCV